MSEQNIPKKPQKHNTRTIDLPFLDTKNGVEIIQNIIEIEKLSLEKFYQLVGQVQAMAMMLKDDARAERKATFTLIPGGE